MRFRQGCQVTTDVAPETATNAQHYSLNSHEIQSQTHPSSLDFVQCVKCDCDTKMCQASTDAVPCRDASYQCTTTHSHSEGWQLTRKLLKVILPAIQYLVSSGPLTLLEFLRRKLWRRKMVLENFYHLRLMYTFFLSFQILVSRVRKYVGPP